jgi:tetratricopeptide (TPR) repeat protein
MSVLVPPVVVRDPRFVAGRATVGEAPSVTIFATLLQEAVAKYGESHIETASAYYEYGNALFRLAQRQQEDQHQPEQHITEGTDGDADTQKKRTREAAALAAERRAQRDAALSKADAASVDVDIPSSPCKAKKEPEQSLIVDSANGAEAAANDENDQPENHVDSNDNEGDGKDDDDIQLALEMMETAWSILDYESGLAPHLDGNDSSDGTDAVHQSSPPKYAQWIDEQLPRVLIGIGDVLSALGRHADSADAYLRALEHRQRELDSALLLTPTSLGLLQCRRKVVETNILIAEELLACDNDHAIETSETRMVLVPAGQAIEYARGYYNKARARDERQETVVLLGQMAAAAAATISAEEERRFSEEKENVCFAATLVMGVGEALAELDEQRDAAAATGKEPNPKKSKSIRGTGS